MARKSRIFIPNIMQYVSLETEETNGMFVEQSDYDAFMEILKKACNEVAIDIHSYILLTKSFEFLCTPHSEEALAKLMQILARRYIYYFNKKYNHKGTLWKRRYTSILVEDEFIYNMTKYIELKALNAVEDEKQYLYSSINANLDRENNPIVAFHKEFSKKQYKQNFLEYLPQEKLNFIEQQIAKYSVIGDARFIKTLEEKMGITLGTSKRGRPKKNNSAQRKNMYKNLVILDKVKHKTLKLSPMENLLFAKEMQVFPLVYSEIATAAKEYPLVFLGKENLSLNLLASLGQTNLAITQEGKWIGKSVPMTLRKYPFAIAPNGEDKEKNIVLIDEDASLLSKSKGKQLFKKSGELTDILKQSIEFISQYNAQMTNTLQAVKEIQQSGILEEKEIRINNKEESKALVNGFQVVNETKLAKLNKELLEKWEKNGILAIVQAHLASLKNVQKLFNLAKNRQV